MSRRGKDAVTLLAVLLVVAVEGYAYLSGSRPPEALEPPRPGPTQGPEWPREAPTAPAPVARPEGGPPAPVHTYSEVPRLVALVEGVEGLVERGEAVDRRALAGAVGQAREAVLGILRAEQGILGSLDPRQRAFCRRYPAVDFSRRRETLKEALGLVEGRAAGGAEPAHTEPPGQPPEHPSWSVLFLCRSLVEMDEHESLRLRPEQAPAVLRWLRAGLEAEAAVSPAVEALLGAAGPSHRGALEEGARAVAQRSFDPDLQVFDRALGRLR